MKKGSKRDGGGGGRREGCDQNCDYDVGTWGSRLCVCKVHLTKPLQAFGTAHQTQCPPATGLSSPPVNTDPY